MSRPSRRWRNGKHPELFADIDPDATLRDINSRFLAAPLEGTLLGVGNREGAREAVAAAGAGFVPRKAS